MNSDNKKVKSEMGTTILNEYAAFMTKEGQDFIVNYENFAKPVLKSDNNNLQLQYSASCITMRVLWEHYNKLKVFEQSDLDSTIMTTRLHELFNRFNEDVDSFVNAARSKIL